MKLLSFITKSRVNPRKGNPVCPYCDEPMWEMGPSDAFDGKINRAEEPKHCYRCRNEECGEHPLYRRMDVEDQNKGAQQTQAASEMREQEHASFLLLNQEVTTLTKWLRERRPDKIGSANKLSDILISILEEK